MSLAQQAVAELNAAHEFFNRSTRNLTEEHSERRAGARHDDCGPAGCPRRADRGLVHSGRVSAEGFDVDFEKAAKEVNAYTSLAKAREWFERAMAAAKATVGRRATPS